MHDRSRRRPQPRSLMNALDAMRHGWSPEMHWWLMLADCGSDAYDSRRSSSRERRAVIAPVSDPFKSLAIGASVDIPSARSDCAAALGAS